MSLTVDVELMRRDITIEQIWTSIVSKRQHNMTLKWLLTQPDVTIWTDWPNILVGLFIAISSIEGSEESANKQRRVQ